MKKIIEFVNDFVVSERLKDFTISGTAIETGISRNGVFYSEEELRFVGNKFGGKPILLDHKNEVKNIVGRVIKSWYDERSRSIKFDARIMDEDIKKMINDGRIDSVSIGASVQDLIKQEDGSKLAKGLTPLELSLVAVAGVASAHFTKNIMETFKGELICTEKLNESNGVMKGLVRDICLVCGFGMTRMPEAKPMKKCPECNSTHIRTIKGNEESLKGGIQMDEEIQKTEIKVDISDAAEKMMKLKEESKMLKKRLGIRESADVSGDETKGKVGNDDEDDEEAVESAGGYVLEVAENGKGFSFYRDYEKVDKNKTKLKRLVR